MSPAASTKQAAGSETLLVELLVEEMPPRLAVGLAQQFAAALRRALAAGGFVQAQARFCSHATPRRLAALIEDCQSTVAASRQVVRGPAWSACLDAAGRPTAALRGFAAAQGCTPEKIGKADFDGRLHARAIRRIAARKLEKSLAEIIETAARATSAPRLMRWGDSSRRFVRPLRALLAMHGRKVLSISTLDLQSSPATVGHRARTAGRSLPVPAAGSYVKTLASRHKVIVDFSARCDCIDRQLADLAAPDRLIADSDLVAENAAMTENPQVYAAGFGREFLELPPEVIGACLKQHMRCFVLAKRSGQLAPRFLLVADNRPAAPAAIVAGFERVVAARLADARFYWQADREEIAQGIHERKLEQLTYHPRIGSVATRIRRIGRIADALVQLKIFAAADAKQAAAAARLCKLDLATHMINEYPQLEGIMAARYFIDRKKNPRLAGLVAGHLDAGRDKTPSDPAHWPLVIATETERIAGLLAAGERLGADRDPHGLRRAAVRLATVLARQPGIEFRSMLAALIAATIDGEEFSAIKTDADALCRKIIGMVLDRIRNQSEEILGLQKQPPTALVAAVVDEKQQQIQIGGYPARIAALDDFLASSAGKTLIAAHKRVANILRKSAPAKARTARLSEDAEIALAGQIEKAKGRIDAAEAVNDYRSALAGLADLAAPVDEFFAKVMVNAPDPALRAARHALMEKLSCQLNRIADLSRLSG